MLTLAFAERRPFSEFYVNPEVIAGRVLEVLAHTDVAFGRLNGFMPK